MILDSGNMIEFNPKDDFKNGKTAEEESKKAYEELNKLPAYKDKIERAVKLLGEEQHFVVKWTDKELEMLKRFADKLMAQKEGADSIPIYQPEEEKAKEKEKQKEELEEKKKELTGEKTKESIENIDLGLLVNRDNLADMIEKTRK
jgi:hypothetical protein